MIKRLSLPITARTAGNPLAPKTTRNHARAGGELRKSMHHVFGYGSFVLLGWVMAAGGAAQSYPVKTVRIIVPQAAGGGSDTVARLLAAELTKAWGQQVIVDNRVGAGGIIGSEQVARAAADGYTLLVNEVGGMLIRLSAHAKLPFDALKDLTAVGMVAYGANAVVTHPSIPVRSMKELFALAKARPGQLNFAVPGMGSVAHLAGVELEQLAGVQWTYIPYKGGAPAIVDVVAGQADFGVNGMFSVFPHWKSGRLRILAVASRERHPSAPDLPTLAETIGGSPSGSWQGVLAPAGVPRDTLARWNSEIARINATPAMREKLAAFGAVAESMTPEQMQQFMAAERTRWARLVREARIKLD
jgi:tripartite-type tricarboxylate transporter receptor subunit TctC